MAKPKHRGLKLLVLVGVLAGGAYGAHRAGWTDQLLAKDEVPVLEGAPVRRGDLRVSEVVRGNLEAKDSASLRSQLEGRSTIIYLEKEGTRVEKGHLVAELDVTATEDERVRQEIAVQQAELDVTKAEKQVEIQEIENQTDLAAADLEVELARLDLLKYEDEANGDWLLELTKAQEAVQIQKEEETRAKNELDWTVKLADKGFIQANQLEADRLAKQRAEIELLQAQRDLEAKIKYGNVRKLAELNAEVTNRVQLKLKTEKQAEARMVDFTAALRSAEYKLAREREQLAKNIDQISKGKLYAPEAGLLVYSREQGRMGNTEVIQEGQEVRERQELMSIPRAGGMVVKASIHETKLKKIHTGQACVITVDAFPNRVFNGRVDFVAVMADSGSWRTNPNLRLYKAEIAMLDGIIEMRPGMSCNVEILIEDLKDVLYVPRQCVLLDGGETIVFMQQGKDSVRRKVEVGLDNAKWVSIESGLVVGDTVLLAPPANFDPAPVPDAQADPMAAAAMSGMPGAAPTAGERPISAGGASTAEGRMPEGFDPSRMRGQGGSRGAGGAGAPEGGAPTGARGADGRRPRGDGGAPSLEGAGAGSPAAPAVEGGGGSAPRERAAGARRPSAEGAGGGGRRDSGSSGAPAGGGSE